MENSTPSARSPKKASLDRSPRVTTLCHSGTIPATAISQLGLCPGLKIRSGAVFSGSRDVVSRYDFLQGCRKWACPVCGPKKRAQLKLRIAAGDPNRFVTLTTFTKTGETPREVFLRTSKHISTLFRPWKKKNPNFRYVRILESTKAGFPHYHFCMHSQFIQQLKLSQRWERLTGAKIVDIRKLFGAKINYITKYVTKNSHVDYTRQRITFSRNWPKLEKQEIDVDFADWSITHNDELADYAGCWINKSGLQDLGSTAIMHTISDAKSGLILEIADQFGIDSTPGGTRRNSFFVAPREIEIENAKIEIKRNSTQFNAIQNNQKEPKTGQKEPKTGQNRPKRPFLSPFRAKNSQKANFRQLKLEKSQFLALFEPKKEDFRSGQELEK